jgi:3-hydroxymyristoyl/3-hydroxydecanoyl-(acyl carrier protein) dehydratase
VAGRRASLAGLTATLLGIDGVQDGVMVMPEAADGGTAVRPCAIVVAPGLSPKTILDALRRSVDAVFVPRRVVMVDALPRDPLGKLPKAHIAALLEAASDPVTSITVAVPLDHPALEGHFPGRPIVPGVVLLDAIVRAARASFAVGRLEAVTAAKFTRPVAGGASIALQLRRTAPARIAYEARLDGDLVAAGYLGFAKTDSP